mgnify:CR=1 FL=1
MFNIDKYIEIKEYIKKLGKSAEIVAISKNHSLESVETAIHMGVKVFGENRVQEAKSKFEKILIKKPETELHLTGPLQTNKVKHALKIFDVFHTLDREKLLKEFSKYQELIEKKIFFVQVNTGKELSKSGVFPENVKKFIGLCDLHGVKNIQGLMCIPPINEDPKKHFKLISDISIDLGFSGLSIGMSTDYKEALEFNPSHIRLGTVLFGKRK